MAKGLKIAGFTLLEVLIALIILAIAFSGTFLSLSLSAQRLVSLQDKTAAEWVGLNVIAKLRIGVLSPKDNLSGTEAMFAHDWQWQATLSSTQDAHVSRILVKVGKKGNVAPTTQIAGYLFNYNQ